MPEYGGSEIPLYKALVKYAGAIGAHAAMTDQGRALLKDVNDSDMSREAQLDIMPQPVRSIPNQTTPTLTAGLLDSSPNCTHAPRPRTPAAPAPSSPLSSLPQPRQRRR